MHISKTDILWSYAATFLKIASAALLLPLIIIMMPSETVGIWSIFMTISIFTRLLDFGFNPSFTRNITYVFSGVRSLKVKGFEAVTTENKIIDFGLLKGVISTMRWFYFRMAIVLFLLLSTFGTYYIYLLLKNYSGNTQEVYIAWALLCIISTYNLYTIYYQSLLLGKGMVKRSNQIVIVGNIVYLAIASILIIAGYGLVAIVSAQFMSVIIIRWLSYHSFFNIELKQRLHNTKIRPQKEILKAISPNALKLGLTAFGGFMVQRSAIIIGSLYVTLEEIASYGITMQLISVISGLAGIYTITYQPKIAQLRVSQKNQAIKQIYLKGQLLLLLTFIIAGMILLLLGERSLHLIGSRTQLMSSNLILLALILLFEQTNLSIAGTILLTKNEVPFFKASLISGVSIVFGLFLFLKFFNWGLLTMLLVPLFVDIFYQTWKWPLEVIKELDINFKDILKILNIRKV